MTPSSRGPTSICPSKIGNMITRSEQLSRASVAAAFAVVTAAMSHTVAGGEVPSVVAVALSFLLATLVSIPLVGKSASLMRISATVFLGQMVLHGLYELFPATSSSTAVATVGSTSLMGMHDHSLSLITMPATLGEAATAPAMWMSVAHVVAGVLAIVVLRNADVALAVVRAARGFVLTIFELPATRSALPQVTRTAAQVRNFPRPAPVFFSVVHRRGPPRSA
jgi:hypothetical protein